MYVCLSDRVSQKPFSDAGATPTRLNTVAVDGTSTIINITADYARRKY